MKIAVWRTGHEIADTVAEAVARGLVDNGKERLISYADTKHIELAACADINIGYGILRGMSEVYLASEQANKPWFNIDRGYWKPGHYDGYYRVSLRGTQQTFGLDRLEPNYARWDALGIDILPYVYRDYPLRMMCCPPTDCVRQFFGDDCWPKKWPNDLYLVRNKDCSRSLQEDLDKSRTVTTFNSSVGWEAFRQGIPVVSDPQHSIVGAYQKLIDKSIHDDSNERRKLFGIMASLQLTLSEMREGHLWQLLQKLISISSLAGTDAKQSLQTLPPIPSALGQNPL